MRERFGIMSLHIIEEAIGRLRGVESVAVIMGDVVQGGKGPHYHIQRL